MIKHLYKYKGYILLVVILMVIEPTINSVLNFWLQRIFNSATEGGNKILAFRLLTGGFLLWMLKRVVTFSSNVLKDRFITSVKKDIKHNMFYKLIGLNTSNISETTSSGEYMSIFTNDIALIEQRFLSQVISLVSGMFSIVILGTSFVIMNAKLAIAIILFGLIAMFVPVFFSSKLNEKNLEYSKEISLFTQKIKEYLVAYPTIKNYSIEKTIIEKFDKCNNSTEDTKFEADFTVSLANNVGMLLAWFMQFIGVGLGIVMVIKGEILIGTVIAAQSFASDLALPLQNIVVNFISIRSVKDIIEKIEKLSYECENKRNETEQIKKKNNEIVKFDKCDICFEKLNLQIKDKQIIDNFSFKFESGKKYLIVGINGSGKSSIFKALKKWYDICEGEILVNDVDVSQMRSEDLSKLVSYLNENVSLFSGTVRENIALFRDYNSSEFSDAVSVAHVALDLERNIIDEGRNISSGEKRRIEIARSLLESVKVLIFDEVVSTLDIETAYEIEKLALEFKDKTVIFISHNFSGKLIHQYDEILVMDSGKLLSHGTYDELIKRCEYFRKICEIKFG